MTPSLRNLLWYSVAVSIATSSTAERPPPVVYVEVVDMTGKVRRPSQQEHRSLICATRKIRNGFKPKKLSVILIPFRPKLAKPFRLHLTNR